MRKIKEYNEKYLVKEDRLPAWGYSGEEWTHMLMTGWITEESFIRPMTVQERQEVDEREKLLSRRAEVGKMMSNLIL